MKKSPKQKRQFAEAKGRFAEWLAARVLQLKGYRVLCHRFRSKSGEIDLVCLHKDVVVLVEVKARSSHESAKEAVTWHSRQRIEAAGQDFLTRHPSLMALGLRYDIISVKGLSFRHIKDAWRSGE
jgi:putative endonuclease